jgi:tRNA-2-methylthio-N6-dimethylallyladenosine synthase
MIGRFLPVLFEKPGRHEGQLLGRSPFLQPVHAQGPVELIGSVAEVEIRERGVNSLGGRIAVPAALRQAGLEKPSRIAASL